MKGSIIIAEKNILVDSDTKSWIEISKKLEQNKVESTSNIKKVIKRIQSRFPEIPNKMVWGNYLIFEEHENIAVIDIDYNNLEKLKQDVLNIALNNNLAVLIGKENKIYRDISELK
ncbi:hypothetical protein FGM00_01550 [Aggregatimonas sangjinii]|uniref:Uncharacterized protein n=1 Tax=Aggregatimonas sangjinii TaxID=2583587 RepID=A0A5B7SPB8_9FLAO|nr:hypothetical protein [Aggregatimonas sangjinii]QCW98867.1 hypothetical protein FGM00_01550 [Aggregatimonas sangjinii]